MGCSGTKPLDPGGGHPPTPQFQGPLAEGDTIATLALKAMIPVAERLQQSKRGHLTMSREVAVAVRNQCERIAALLDEDESTDEVVDAKAMALVIKGSSEQPDPTPSNVKVRMLLTSVGLMPDSGKTAIAAYKKLAAVTPGKGVLICLDAKMKTLQFCRQFADPNSHNHLAAV